MLMLILYMKMAKAVFLSEKYHKISQYSDRSVRAHSADPDLTADLGLQCLQYHLHF